MKNPFLRWVAYLLVTICAAFSLFPFYWMSVIATRSAAEISAVPPAIFYGNKLVENMHKVIFNDNINFLLTLGNSFLISTVITASMLLFSSLAGFAFARLRFRGSRIMLFFVLGSMMIPLQLGLIPQYMIISKLNWLNDLKAVIVPGMVSAFGVFFMRQYIDAAVPNEMLEAGKIDGCSNAKLYYRLVVPTIAPAFATLGILTFMNSWNDFLWPSIVLKSNEMLTVQLALVRLDVNTYYADKSLIMAGSVLATLPLFLIFLFFNRQFIAGVTEGAVKG
ncbi:carbohydrate ABC transporter permease [Paenibacillus kobensis]|uniref:carbohydrate ABC transporter permease n=1 Tax=Paenibacillus kobensis TaxID=59841 RepID=UPI000FD70AB0|nr:carbohydrate ABC transporter permease [Paenibacillus kobensis]